MHVVKWLVDEGGANIEVFDRYQNTPLIDAIRHKQDEVIKYLQSVRRDTHANTHKQDRVKREERGVGCRNRLSAPRRTAVSRRC
jgi:ankyrin repeat protein